MEVNDCNTPTSSDPCKQEEESTVFFWAILQRSGQCSAGNQRVQTCCCGVYSTRETDLVWRPGCHLCVHRVPEDWATERLLAKLEPELEGPVAVCACGRTEPVRTWLWGLRLVMTWLGHIGQMIVKCSGLQPLYTTSGEQKHLSLSHYYTYLIPVVTTSYLAAHQSSIVCSFKETVTRAPPYRWPQL